MKNFLITGGAGFIGANFVHHLLAHHPDYQVVVYDKLTYAGNLNNLADVSDDPRYTFIRGDICDAATVARVIQEQRIDTIVNFAAETHVDRSILDPDAFIQTDVYGTYVLLEAARRFGLADDPSQTPLERAGALAGAVPQAASGAAALADLYTRDLFSPHPITLDDASQAQLTWMELRPLLWRNWLDRRLRLPAGLKRALFRQ